MSLQAVIQTGGKQYQVSKGDKISVEKLEGNAGSEIVFDKVLLIHGENTKIGAPYVDGAKVTGKILDQEKAKKVIIYKYKKRKGYHKKQGHRQELTCIEISEIQISTSKNYPSVPRGPLWGRVGIINQSVNVHLSTPPS